MKRILVLNLGSTSFKFKLYEMGDQETLIATGGVERIGAENGLYEVKSASGLKEEGSCVCPVHADGLEVCMNAMKHIGLAIDMTSLDVLGYKAVHGGRFSGSQYVTEELIAEMERMVPFAPAHNPIYLSMMKAMGEKYPNLVQIACFETAFHATIPLERAVYGVPYEWMQEYGIRRYGFHGSSHSYIAWKMSQIAPENHCIISAHMGGSSSLCAIRDGKSIAASMGATPQSGVFHNNRVGDLDVFTLPVLVEKYGSFDKVMSLLSKESGFQGLSGVSNDVRFIEEEAAAGNQRSELALNAFADEVAGYIGMYAAYLGHLDAVVFTGGIGFKDTIIRKKIVDRLGLFHAKMDESKNIRAYEGKLSTPDSGVELWAMETNEEIMVARGCMKLLNGK